MILYKAQRFKFKFLIDKHPLKYYFFYRYNFNNIGIKMIIIFKEHLKKVIFGNIKKLKYNLEDICENINCLNGGKCKSDKYLVKYN